MEYPSAPPSILDTRHPVLFGEVSISLGPFLEAEKGEYSPAWEVGDPAFDRPLHSISLTRSAQRQRSPLAATSMRPASWPVKTNAARSRCPAKPQLSTAPKDRSKRTIE